MILYELCKYKQHKYPSPICSVSVYSAKRSPSLPRTALPRRLMSKLTLLHTHPRPRPIMALVVEHEIHNADDTTDDHAYQLERSPEHADALRAMELEPSRRHCSRASASQRSGPTTIARKPAHLLGRFKYTIKQAWKHQVSVTVEHSACRDHLGMYQGYVSSITSYPHPTSTSASTSTMYYVDSILLLYIDWDPEVLLRTALSLHCALCHMGSLQ